MGKQQQSKLFRYGKPAGTRIIVKADEAADKTKSGIIIPDNAKERPQLGTVLAVGMAVTEKVAAGDRIMFGKNAGVQLLIADQVFYTMQEREIFLILDQEAIDKASLEGMLKNEQAAEVVKEKQDAGEEALFVMDKKSYKVGDTAILSYASKSLKGDGLIRVQHKSKTILSDTVIPVKGDNEYHIIITEEMLPEVAIIMSLNQVYTIGLKENTITRDAAQIVEIYK